MLGTRDRSLARPARTRPGRIHRLLLANGAGEGAGVGLILLVAVLQSAASTVTAARVQLVTPTQGFVSSVDALTITWVTTGVVAEGGNRALKLVLMVNGLTAQASEATSGHGEQSLRLNRLEDGMYRVHVVLGEYDDVEGLSKVQSSAFVECWVDSQGLLGGVPPVNPQAFMGLPFTPYAPARRRGARPSRLPVVIFAFHCNRPDFVILQARALKSFFLDDYTLIVINDAQSDDMRAVIAAAAESVGAEAISTPDYLDHSDPSSVVGKIVTWTMQEVALQRFNDSVVMLLEGDIFPVAHFSPLDFLEGYSIAGTQQGRRHHSTGFLLRYLWVGILLMDLKGLPNKHLLNMETAVVGDVGGDTASAMHHFFAASPDVNVRRVLHTSHVHTENGNLNVLPAAARERYEDAFRIELFERSFLHYGSASNWKVGRGFEYFNSAEDFLPAKTAFVVWFVESALNSSLEMPAYDYVFEMGSWDNPTGPPPPVDTSSSGGLKSEL